MATPQIDNARQFPQIFYARHMQPGICGYENETILVDTDAIKNMLPSLVGKPVYIHHQNVDLKNLKEKADGYVTEAFYNELDGWGWCKILAVDDEAHKAIAKGWSVSNAYIPGTFGPGGTKNNCPFDREVRNGDFTHLAIVPDPRYEEACIMSPEEFKTYQESKRRQLQELQNNKKDSQKGKPPMFKLFKNEKKEVTEVDGDTMVELENGMSVSVTEMVNALKTEPMVEVEGKKIPLSELVTSYQNHVKANAKKPKKNADKEKGEDDDCMENEDDEESDKNKKKDEDEESGEKGAKKNKKAKKNSDDEDDDKEKKNDAGKAGREEADRHYEELRNAHLKGQPDIQKIDLGMDQMARGKERYGSQPTK